MKNKKEETLSLDDSVFTRLSIKARKKGLKVLAEYKKGHPGKSGVKKGTGNV